MNQIYFKYLDKCDFEDIFPQMFLILHTNMSAIAPTGNSYDSDFRIWMSHILPALEAKNRETILFYINSKLIGYLRYSVNHNTQSLLIEDIQIKAAFQGIGAFSACLKWLVKQLPNDILNVEAYVDKRNNRSRVIMEHLGMACKGENKNGVSLYLKGDYSTFCSKVC